MPFTEAAVVAAAPERTVLCAEPADPVALLQSLLNLMTWPFSHGRFIVERLGQATLLDLATLLLGQPTMWTSPYAAAPAMTIPLATVLNALAAVNSRGLASTFPGKVPLAAVLASKMPLGSIGTDKQPLASILASKTSLANVLASKVPLGSIGTDKQPLASILASKTSLANVLASKAALAGVLAPGGPLGSIGTDKQPLLAALAGQALGVAPFPAKSPLLASVLAAKAAAARGPWVSADQLTRLAAAIGASKTPVAASPEVRNVAMTALAATLDPDDIEGLTVGDFDGIVNKLAVAMVNDEAMVATMKEKLKAIVRQHKSDAKAHDQGGAKEG